MLLSCSRYHAFPAVLDTGCLVIDGHYWLWSARLSNAHSGMLRACSVRPQGAEGVCIFDEDSWFPANRVIFNYLAAAFQQ